MSDNKRTCEETVGKLACSPKTYIQDYAQLAIYYAAKCDRLEAIMCFPRQQRLVVGKELLIDFESTLVAQRWIIDAWQVNSDLTGRATTATISLKSYVEDRRKSERRQERRRKGGSLDRRAS